jgi:hypothetical protein
MPNKELDGLMKKLMAKSKRELEAKNKKSAVDRELDKISLTEFKNVELTNSGRLSDEQIENWRKVLCGIVGPYALVMPKEDIQKFRDKMQANADLVNEDWLSSHSSDPYDNDDD